MSVDSAEVTGLTKSTTANNHDGSNTKGADDLQLRKCKYIIAIGLLAMAEEQEKPENKEEKVEHDTPTAPLKESGKQRPTADDARLARRTFHDCGALCLLDPSRLSDCSLGSQSRRHDRPLHPLGCAPQQEAASGSSPRHPQRQPHRVPSPAHGAAPEPQFPSQWPTAYRDTLDTIWRRRRRIEGFAGDIHEMLLSTDGESQKQSSCMVP